MTRPIEIATAVSEVCGVPFATVRHMARALRDAGCMTHASAGRGDGGLTPSDAASLLVATAVAGVNIKSGAESVSRHSATVDTIASDIRARCASTSAYELSERVGPSLRRVVIIDAECLPRLSGLFS